MTKQVKYEEGWKTNGYTNIKNAVLFDEYLSAMAKTIYFQLLGRDFNDETISFPSQKTMAKENGTTVRTVQRKLDELVDTGLISKQRRFNSSNVYTLEPLTKRYPKFKGKQEHIEDKQELDYYADLR